MRTYCGTAIGGPKDRLFVIESNRTFTVLDVSTDKEVPYTFVNVGDVGVWLAGDIAIGEAMRIVMDVYQVVGEKTPSSTNEGVGGKSIVMHDAMQTMSDKIARQGETIIAIKDANERLAAGLKADKKELEKIREICAAGGFVDQDITTQSLVSWMRDTLERKRKELDLGAHELDQVVAELKASGHNHEGRPISALVDIAIDTERTKRDDMLARIAEAAQISFAVGTKPVMIVDTLVNVIASKFRGSMMVKLSGLGGAGSASAGGGFSGAVTLEKRVTALEERFDSHMGRAERSAKVR